MAFWGFCDYRDEIVGYVPFATKNSSDVNPLYPTEYVLSEVRKYKQIYDYVYVLPHWGFEHTWFPQYNTINLTKKILAAGADDVFGSHPHRVQPICHFHNHYACFSMGNFFFPDRYINTPRPTYYPPAGTDTSRYPVTDVYPYVQEPTLKIWKPLGRIGLIISLSLTSKSQMSVDYVLTSLSSNNILSGLNVVDSAKLRKMLHNLRVIITYALPLYVLSITLRRSLGILKRKFISYAKKNIGYY